jgi:hypothetical protein
MPQMGVLGDFYELAKDLIKAGPDINAAARKQIRQVVGALGDELETVLDITIIYLRTGAATPDSKKLEEHLYDAPAKLLGYYKEFKVCEGLYGLRDEFDQVFNAKRWAVSIRDFWRLPNLVRDLAVGERSMLDDLRDIVQALTQLSDKLRSKNTNPSEREHAVEAVHCNLREMISDLEQRKNALRASVRVVIDKL